MTQTTINRLQTPLRQEFLKKLSANFRPVGKVGETRHGQLAFRSRVHSCCGIILIEANQKVVAAHTMEISQEATTAFSASGGTPAGATVTGGVAWDEIDYAAASVVTPGVVPVTTPSLITASNSSPPAIGAREVTVP